MKEIKKRTKNIVEQLMTIWENSVKETHTFLSQEEIYNIKKYVPSALTSVSYLIVEYDTNNHPIAFMGIDNEKLEMLFISPIYRGKGIGSKLIEYGIKNYNIKEVVVNEQNPQAKGFYEHIGFTVYKRSELDEQGNPYPILFMKYTKTY